MRVWEKIKKSWEKSSEFEKYFFKTLFIIVIILFILEISQINILEPIFNWISQAFSVPVHQSSKFGIDASGILFILIFLVVLIIWPIKKFIQSIKSFPFSVTL